MNRVGPYFLKFSVPWPKTLIWKLAVISDPLEQSIALRGDKFLKKYSSSANYLCRLIAKH